MDKVEKEKLFSPSQNTGCRGYPVKSGQTKTNLSFLHNTVRERLTEPEEEVKEGTNLESLHRHKRAGSDPS